MQRMIFGDNTSTNGLEELWLAEECITYSPRVTGQNFFSFLFFFQACFLQVFYLDSVLWKAGCPDPSTNLELKMGLIHTIICGTKYVSRMDVI